jgi:hypothetical protein
LSTLLQWVSVHPDKDILEVSLRLRKTKFGKDSLRSIADHMDTSWSGRGFAGYESTL